MNSNNPVALVIATTLACVFALLSTLTALAQDDAIAIAIASAADNPATDVADTDSDPTEDGTREFRLFESIDNSASSSTRTRNQARANRASRAAASTPEFSLVGTTRIGDEHRVILSHRGGDTIVVRVGSNGPARISGYTDYSIAAIEAGKVSLNYPAATPCVDFPEQGVKCTGSNNSAELTLAKGTPLASRRLQSAEPERLQEQATSGATPPDTAPTNPFAALSAAAAEDASGRDGNSSSARFNPRRIDPEDVPPGMRVVSTPFGDRLVDI